VPWEACTAREADSASGACPSSVRTNPAITMTKTLATNPYVGIANARPDSLTPRRFMTAITTMSPSEIPTACGPSLGNAETMLATPAATETATVMT
jgi:hypothetical protein